MRKIFVCFFALLTLSLSINIPKAQAQETTQEEITRQLSQTPPNIDKPTEVSIGLYLVDFNEFNEKEESFKLEGYLFLTWRDKRLAFKSSQLGANNKFYKLDEIWTPNVLFLNVQDQRNIAYRELKVKPDGTVYYKERFTGKFNSEINLKKFPFDSQGSKLILTSTNNSKNIVFTEDKTKIGISQNAFLAGWTIGDAMTVTRVSNFKIEDAYFPEFIYEINLSRFYTPYILNIIFPLLFIIGVSWTVFWSRSFESNAVIATSSLLSAIAFNIVIVDELPKVSYLTFINGFIVIIYAFIFLIIIYTVVKHLLDLEKQKELSSKIDRTARWLVPIMFGVSNIILIAIFLL